MTCLDDTDAAASPAHEPWGPSHLRSYRIMGRADVYLQPQAGDPLLADAVVLDLARRHAPAASTVTAVDESGGEARVYLVDDNLVVKTQRPHRSRPRTSLAKEAYLLDLLAGALGERIPRLLGYAHADTAHGPVEYVCMTRIRGQAARLATMTGPARRTLLTELGALLRTVHATPVEVTRMPIDIDAAALRQRMLYAFGDIADVVADLPAVPARLPVPLEEVIDRAIAALPGDLTPVALHSNPGPTHVFVDPATGRFTGVIDFGDAYASHPALDLHRWPDPVDRILLREAYLDGAADPRFDRMWTVAMIHTDLAVIASNSPHAKAATADLVDRLGSL